MVSILTETIDAAGYKVNLDEATGMLACNKCSQGVRPGTPQIRALSVSFVAFHPVEMT